MPEKDSFVSKFNLSSRTIQLILGFTWILDGLLQMQPKMFGSDFVKMVILPNSIGQPSFIASFINSVGHLMLHKSVVWNLFFVIAQLAIGTGILTKRFVKQALVASIVWSAGVWVLGEGFGMLLTGTASPLLGAPGAVLIYALVGLMIYPKSKQNASNSIEQPNSIGAEGALGKNGPILVWSGLWLLYAILWLAPANRYSDSVHSQLVAAAAGQPSWLHSFILSVARIFAHAGLYTSVILAVMSLIFSLGPLFSKKPHIYLWLGSILSLFFWITGEAFGGIFTGMGTDPNIGPLVVLLALTAYPSKIVYADNDEARLGSFLINKPQFIALFATTLFMILGVLTVQPAHGSTMASQMTMEANASSGSSSSPQNSMKGMDMGNPAILASWKYTGPALSSFETQILTTVNSLTDQGHQMQTPNCNSNPTPQQMLAAEQLIQKTSEAISKFQNINVAIASGYFPITDPIYPVVHYINLKYMTSKYVLDPNHIQSLVYARVPSGQMVLVAGMYLTPSAAVRGPMPGGCLTQWHRHTNLCMSLSTHYYSGFAPCGSGSVLIKTPWMLHVWQVPVPGGPLALDPSDLQTVEAAIMSLNVSA